MRRERPYHKTILRAYNRNILFQYIVIFLKNYFFDNRFFRLNFFKQISYIVVDEYKFIYISIHKIAGSSLKTTISNLLHLNINIHDIHNFNNFNYILRSQVEDKKFNDYFKFSFVRNPWDRVVSCYLNKIIPSAHTLDKKLFSKYPWWKEDMTFREFVIAISNTSDIYSDEHFKSQYSFIYNENGTLLADFIGRFETLNQDFEYVCKKLNIQNVHLPHRNASSRKHYSEYYDEETKKLVAKRYKQDIELFGYVFEDTVKV